MPWRQTLIGLLIWTGTLAAGDWPQWLGPTRDSASSEKVAVWKEAPTRLWSVSVGEGHSSPVVAGGKVFLHSRVKGEEVEEIVAFDAATGKKLWTQTYPRVAFSSPFGTGPRATPCVRDGKVYAFGVTGVLSCRDAGNGQEHWRVDTLNEFKAPNLKFGISSSPIVDGGNVLVQVGAGATVVAFNKDSGKVAWKSLKDPASYASPIVIGEGKERQAIFFTQQGVASLRPTDGNLYWNFPLVDLLNESSTTPIRVGKLLLASSVTYGGVGLRLETKDGKPAATQAWKNSALSCYFATPVTVGEDYVYMVTGALLPPSATLRCVDVKTGKETWHKDKIGKYHTTLLRTGDNKLLLLDDAGSLALVEPDPKEYRELARAKVCGQTWAHPALANGRLYIRDARELICLKLGE